MRCFVDRSFYSARHEIPRCRQEPVPPNREKPISARQIPSPWSFARNSPIRKIKKRKLNKDSSEGVPGKFTKLIRNENDTLERVQRTPSSLRVVPQSKVSAEYVGHSRSPTTRYATDASTGRRDAWISRRLEIELLSITNGQ